MCILIDRFEICDVESRESSAGIIELSKITSCECYIVHRILNRILIIGKELEVLLKHLFAVALYIVSLYLLVDRILSHAPHKSILCLCSNDLTKERRAVKI